MKFLSLVAAEVGYWLRRDWSFGEVGQHWDDTEDYDEINSLTDSYFRRFTDAYEISDCSPKGVVLDLCARTGQGTNFFYKKGKVRFAVCADVSWRMGQVLRQRLRSEGIDSHAWIPIYSYDLPFRDGSFDSVLCFETVEHFPHPERLVNELGRVTRVGGTLILTTPKVLWEPVHALAAITGLHHSEGPHRFIRSRRLRQIVRNAGFKIDAVRTCVLIPAGPRWLIKLGRWIESRTRGTLTSWFGLRQILICSSEGDAEVSEAGSGVSKSIACGELQDA